MACIKYLSQCACARCLVLKSKFPLLGSKRDMQDRVKLKRVDDEARREKIESARKLIFEKGISLGSKRITDILGAKSLVPTRVCPNDAFLPCSALTISIECILRTLIRSWIQLLRAICSRPPS